MFDKPSMIPEGAVKLAPPELQSPTAAESGSSRDQPWLSRDAPYDRMTGLVCSATAQYTVNWHISTSLRSVINTGLGCVLCVVGVVSVRCAYEPRLCCS